MYSGIRNVQRFYLSTSMASSESMIIKAMPLETATVALARSLRMSVIAEGVETREQIEFLESVECEEMQGFYFSGPLPPGQLYDFLRSDAVVFRKKVHVVDTSVPA